MDMVALLTRSGWTPNADVVVDDAEGALVVRVEVAGADSESLRVFVDERYLFISGRRAETARLRHGSYLQKEIPDGSFVKRIPLPASVAQESVAATYEAGMLTIRLPLANPSYRPTSRTEIRLIVKRIL